MGFFTDRERIFKPDRIRIIFLILGVLAFAITELFRLRLRPLIRSFEINDFGFTDTIGNSGGIIVQIFIGLVILNPTRNQTFRLATFFSAGYILYEFAQPYLPKGTFDWNDVIATAIGYVVAMVLLKHIWSKFENTETNEEL